MFKFTPIESGVKYSLVVQGDKNKTEPIHIANFCGLFLGFDVNDILILHYDNIILKYRTIAIDKRTTDVTIVRNVLLLL
jgi:hypothetical protein